MGLSLIIIIDTNLGSIRGGTQKKIFEQCIDAVTDTYKGNSMAHMYYILSHKISPYMIGLKDLTIDYVTHLFTRIFRARSKSMHRSYPIGKLVA